jgi:ribose transport system substrate-binding protein
MRWRRLTPYLLAGSLLAGLAGGGCGGGHGTTAARSSALVGAARAVVDSVPPRSAYRGPGHGPPAQPPAPIVFVAAELTDGGTAAVARGVQEAARAIGWPLKIVDGHASVSEESAALRAALHPRPGGIILGAINAAGQQPALREARAQGVPVVGWHSTPGSGPDSALNLYSNVTSDPAAVARLAADYVIADSGGDAGALLFTDSEYATDRYTSGLIASELEGCPHCSVLQVFDQPVATAALGTAGEVSAFLQQYGPRFNYIVAVNGAYIEGAAAALRGAGRAGAQQPFSLAAGDGEEAEFARIRSGEYQKAAVAEPLGLEGWQLVDELNRARARQAPSGYVPPPTLITQANVPAGAVFDPDSGYRQNYRRIWNR